MKINKNALISVYDKIDLENIAKFLIKKKIHYLLNRRIVKLFEKANLPYVEISKYTKQKEILNGRVKTLHPKIFGGILAANTQEHQKELKGQKIQISICWLLIFILSRKPLKEKKMLMRLLK